jgi:hypothetical protein
MRNSCVESTEALRQRWAQVFESIPPGPDRHETFLTLVHGPGWQERALAPDAPPHLVQALRILDLDRRIRRLEVQRGLASP